MAEVGEERVVRLEAEVIRLCAQLEERTSEAARLRDQLNECSSACRKAGAECEELEERTEALEAENARLLAVCQEICRLLTDSEEHSYGEIYTSAVDGLKGDDSALKVALEKAREEGRREANTLDYKGMREFQSKFIKSDQDCDSLRAQLAERDARVERLHRFVDRVERFFSAPEEPRSKTLREEARALLAETPAASLAAVREQARRETLEEAAREADSRAAYMVELAIASSSNAIKCCRLADGKQWELRARWLRELAAQPAKEPES